jgi:long-chain fatty acid transport protein
MQHSFKRALFASLSFAALATATTGMAAEGITLIGYGARQKALAGADVADSRDPMSMAVNPAGIVGLPHEFQAGITLLLPNRGYDASGPLVVVAPGHVESGRPAFPVPNGGSVHPIDADSAWGEVTYGNGGINTAYGFNNIKPPIYAPNQVVPTGLPAPFPGAITLKGPLLSPTLGGPFGGGFAGIDLEQSFFSLVYARKFGPVTIGFAPTLAAQMANVQGLKTLAPYSADPYHLSDNGYDWSFGGGFRVGAQYEPLPGLRLGVAGSTPMWMTQFGKYAGAIADHGKLDVPANVSAGVAYDVTPDLTVMADWKHIFYSSVRSLGNSSFPLYPGVLGSINGPGFGWRDTDMESFGIEYRALKPLTLRLGYAHSSPMIGSKDVTLNVLAPAISIHHVSGGFKYEITKNSSIDFATVYAFRNTVSGPEAQPYAAFAYSIPAIPGVSPARAIPVGVAPKYNPSTNITAYLSGLEFSVSYSYKFDTGDTSWFPTHF